MKRLDSRSRNFGYFLYRLSSPVFDPIKTLSGLINYPKFVRDLRNYSQMDKSENIGIMNLYPILSDNTKNTPFDSHYFYQDIWAAKNIFKLKTRVHYDVGSNIEFAGFLTSFTKVVFVDIRPLKVNLKNFKSIKGTLLNLPFRDSSVRSLSSLHVTEHVGLGRYGDPLDPEGTKKACAELARVLSKKGNLYFSLPVGKPRLCFNAHRIHSPKQILRYFEGLKLMELSGINDNGKFIENISIQELEDSNYACGLFRFTKK